MKTEHDWREAMTEVNSTPAVYHLSNSLKSLVFNRLTPAAAEAHQANQIAAMQAKKPIPGPFDPSTDSGLSDPHKALIEQLHGLSDETFLNVFYERLQSLGYEISIDAIQAIQEALKPSQNGAQIDMGVKVELPDYEDSSIPQGTYTVAVKGLEIPVLQVTGPQANAWANHPEILSALGIAHTVDPSGSVVLSQGLRVSAEDSTTYQPSALALIKGIQNGLYGDAKIERFSETVRQIFK
ncbi:hypothetical protein IPC65_24185 [Pseudomonas aeruginosa]|uniref:hypothetical protein n=1 Tax=Pseudomonas aeruginosa TaxID=287 RepID=UPI001067607D|nr:hypothetical protein [Pseudomonas aeruginosa]TEP98120.1 hypothetical protein IPC64_09700 [Pseudomonas aeruginosa]TEQ00654.1 hypothetical protein IPC65_24185 [Pseudomonas aeruginosa]TEQ11028.1 hypothetical protein IPC66_19005 [Pseudomonas aeruginosa]